ncbi:transcription-repair coupling factor [Rothia sp. ZJ932]|uniref:transcription-repair coupling factor n=1 Tax=Rothia sp. ZJ932 TaxID=2810516 RepID=UPI00196778D6|nr:transcription-repair coupling factor [Rothia sp. ZJ932]QRZ61170.1 transcription-repair coupling factor [Rothia sp. ZJ932]
MTLHGLLSLLHTDERFGMLAQRAARPLAERDDDLVIGAVDGIRPALTAEFARGVRASTGATVLAVTATDREAEDLEAAIASYLDKELVEIFPAWETLPHERLSPRSDTVGQRLKVIRALHSPNRPALVIAPVRALLQPIVTGLEKMQTVELTVGEEQDFDGVVKALAQAAYSRVDLVSKRGEFAVRGGILDVFSPVEDHPVRIEFFGDEIENMRWFSVADQRTITSTTAPTSLSAPPCRELLITPQVMSRAAKLKNDFPGAAAMLEKIAGGIYVEGMESLTPLLVDEMTTLLELMPEGSLPLIFEPEKVRSRAHDLVATNEEFLFAAWESASDGQDAPLDLGQNGGAFASGGFRTIAQMRALAFEQAMGWWSFTALGVDDEGDHDSSVFTYSARVPHSFAGNVGDLLDEVGRKVKDGWRIVAVTDGTGPLQRLSELFAEAEIPAARTDDLVAEPSAGIIELTTAAAGKGFMLDEHKIGLLTEADILGKVSPYTTRDLRSGKLPVRRRKKAVDPMSLKAGDYVVHEQHGIGQFIEMTQRPIVGAVTTPGQPKPMKEYLVLEYASSKRGAPKDRLFVPTDQLDQVSNYVGGDAPTLSKMGGSDWAKTKSRARKAVKEIAADLIRLYSARQASRGHAFALDTPWQRELEEAFPYNETPDQLSAINDVKADMEREVPMDRLVSGDVGYGKTEIAVRAAFKAVQDGKQVAILVPTTLLAQQHYETFTERFSGFPVRVAVLSRFQKAKETKEIQEGITNGSIDVVVGTHRLLSETTQFKDLGLVVIDEEQRFGVEHKEKLKTMRTNVDVLAMSATPIPRTLEMSLTGIRETSTLATPPEERHPVLTYVGAKTEKQITAAIRRELMREGQVFYVHNRVSSIERTAAEIQQLVPEARIAVAHGKMSESRLEQIIVDFWERRFDVLVCTTIVETGLDISNANTLIVDGAQNYGLSQLHQLRGRVGRGRERAYAYFLYPVDKPLGEVALERLKAVAAHNELGAGMQLAMKDLEIRGAGNLLGGEQSGHIAGVGFDLYLRLVGEAVANYRGDDTEAAPAEVKIELPVNAHLPHEYVSSERLRLAAYREIAQATSEAALDEVREELIDRYGAVPEPTENLFQVALLRIAAREVGVREIQLMGTKVRVFPVNDLPESRKMRLERMYPGALYKQIPGTEDWQILLPRPKTAKIGGKDLVDREILDWTHSFIDLILREKAPATAPSH